MADLYRELPKTWGSPTMSPHCADEVKYAVADRVVGQFRAMQARGEPLTGQPIRDLVTVNGVKGHGRGRHLGTGPRLIEQAGTGGRGREPGVGSAHARNVRSGRPDPAREPRSRRLQPDDLMRACARARARLSAPRPAQAWPEDCLLRHCGRQCLGGARRLLRPSAEPLLVGAPRLRADAETAEARRLPGTVPQWGLGLTDIAKHVSGVDRELPAGALGREACAALKAKIAAAAPEWLAFTSLNAGRRYLGRAAGFGEQGERIGRTRLWLLPSPSPTAGWNWARHEHWWRRLAEERRLADPEGRGGSNLDKAGRARPRPVQINASKRQ